MEFTRRELIANTFKASAVMAATQVFDLDALAASKYDAIHAQLDSFVESYMRAMNSPGLTLSLADRDGVQRVTTYGFSDKDLRERVQPGQLFEIGSRDGTGIVDPATATGCAARHRGQQVTGIGKLDQ